MDNHVNCTIHGNIHTYPSNTNSLVLSSNYLSPLFQLVAFQGQGQINRQTASPHLGAGCLSLHPACPCNASIGKKEDHWRYMYMNLKIHIITNICCYHVPPFLPGGDC